MVFPAPSHDVWSAVLDSVDDHDLMKTCNVVCLAWNIQLQPRLMASIRIDFTTYPESDRDHLILKQCGHRVRRLRLDGGEWKVRDWRSRIELTPTLFANLVSLDLYQLAFETLSDVFDCISMTANTLESLIIFEFEYIDTDSCPIEWILIQNDSAAQLPTYRPHALALRKMEIDSDFRCCFAWHLWGWITVSPTLSTLRVLEARIGSFEEDDLRSLFKIVNHPDCALEKLNLWIDDYVDNEPIANPPFIMSRTITDLSITAEHESANRNLFDIVYYSTMPSLKALRLYVLANNAQNCCGESPGQRLHNIDLPRQYCALASVHLIITDWPLLGTPHEGVPHEITGTILGSRFLCSCLHANILTVGSYRTIPVAIENEEPDAEWISEGGSLSAVSHSGNQSVL